LHCGDPPAASATRSAPAIDDIDNMDGLLPRTLARLSPKVTSFDARPLAKDG
jgi:hypothetical protein